MAVMQRCCCFDNVRSGSVASAIYTLIYSAVVLALAAWKISVYAPYLALIHANALFVGYCFSLVFLSVMLLSSILVLVGVSRDQRGYLLPYMVVMPLLILLHLAQIIMTIIALASLGYGYGGDASDSRTAVVFELCVVILFALLDLLCFLCVLSQYQELRDGRGRLQDVIAARTLTIVTTTPGVGGAVIVTQQGAPPPAYDMQGSPPQQGYPPQGYPPQSYPLQQGYTRLQEYPEN